jgi:hypothetical protein
LVKRAAPSLALRRCAAEPAVAVADPIAGWSMPGGLGLRAADQTSVE